MLGSDWKSAMATIVAKKYGEAGSRSGTWTYVADVTPEAGSPFRAELKQPPFMSRVIRLDEGDSVNVLADVKRQKAKFDRSNAKAIGKDKPYPKDAFDEALSQPPLTPPPDAD